MENIVTSISLPKEFEEKISKAARERGQTKSGLIQEALRDFLARQELLKIEEKMQAKARAMGIETDEDVTKLIKGIRRKGSH